MEHVLEYPPEHEISALAPDEVSCVNCDSPLRPKDYDERKRLIFQRGWCDTCYGGKIRCKYLPLGEDLFCLDNAHYRLKDGVTYFIPSPDHQIQQQYVGETFETFDPHRNRNAFTKCLNYADQRGWETGPLLVTGATGTGKTHLLNAIRHVARSKHVSTEMILASTMCKAFQDCNKEDQEASSAKDRIHQWRSCDLLFIDELGAEHSPSAFFPRSLLNLLNERTSRNVGEVRVVTATAFDTELLEKRYGDLGPPIISRLLGAGPAAQTTGPDWRKRKR